MSNHHKSTCEKWQKLISEHKSSNLSVIEFCRQKHVHKITFYKWRSRLSKGAQYPERTHFKELKLQKDETASDGISSGVNITINDKFKIVLNCDFDAVSLSRAIKVLGEA